MNKILLIIQREYITRVRKKSFIVMTMLVPALIAGMYAIIAYVATDKSETMHIVNVIDNSSEYKGKFQDEKYVKFNYPDGSLNQAKASLKDDEDLVLNIPANAKDTVTLYAKKKTTLSLTDNIQRQMNDIASGISLVKAGIDTARLHKIKSNIVIKSSEMTDSGEKSTSIGATYALSFAGAILIYMSIFIYGAQVMRGVIEEKTSRIIEVIVSSVKPFQLMMGKIIGVGLVGLTQFVLWIVLSAAIGYFVGHNTAASSQNPIYIFMHNLGSNAGYEIGCFIFYWISGFLFYSALFAAVGSAVDSETETQQFMFPITLPLLFTYLLSVSWLFQAPDSPLAVWLSMIPLSAPVAMMVRIPYNVPTWQLGVSMALMILGFLFTTYVASRIYRVGILMYGKKTSYKELVKWFFYKE
ncbi:ABC-2 type transport system permease protein [Mucilaginibacter frigoritolerans]|jgi:ABC-2 type transport system permease protein|uniref:ABC-2 type transport system permease protein n=1 Tax=Mucilaginibacter frigoritolerans TaxID=652788 RepID=A0A562TSZ8_9SPHI|nr:ABC transporter permease [Mucilaginibacter frigoritolerans]TWI96711.1 ABC-2 type transport system permease protein [Mucilaginibacter frigoritolerans]